MGRSTKPCVIETCCSTYKNKEGYARDVIPHSILLGLPICFHVGKPSDYSIFERHIDLISDAQ